VLKLSRQAIVFGHYGPVVTPFKALRRSLRYHCSTTKKRWTPVSVCVYGLHSTCNEIPVARHQLDTHAKGTVLTRFDSKDHSRYQHTLVVIAVMLYEWSTVKFVANSVSTVLLDRVVTVSICNIVNSAANFCQAASRSASIDCSVQALSSCLNQTTRRDYLGLVFFIIEIHLVRDSSPIDATLVHVLLVAYNHSSAVVTVNTVEITTNIEGNNVSKLEWPSIRNAVANDFINGRAEGFGKTSVIQGRRVSSCLQYGVSERGRMSWSREIEPSAKMNRKNKIRWWV
jgi:hypothetical protein